MPCVASETSLKRVFIILFLVIFKCNPQWHKKLILQVSLLNKIDHDLQDGRFVAFFLSNYFFLIFRVKYK